MRARFGAWFLQALRTNWVAFILVGGIAWVFAYSLDLADWVINDRLIVAAVVLGFLFGWLLAVSRFRAGWAWAYSITLSVLVITISMANLFPLIFQTLIAQNPSGEFLVSMNLRYWTFLYRVGAWLNSIQAGTAVADTGLFVFLASLLAWNATSWLAWSIQRLNRGFTGLLPCGFLLALNVHLSGQGVWEFWFFLVLAALLYIRTHYRSNHHDWDRRNVDYPDDTGLDWSMIALLMAFMIGGLALLSSVVATPDGLKALRQMVRSANEQTADTAVQLFSGVKAPASSEPEITAQIPDLTDFSRPLPQGTDTILWVKTSDPPPPPEDLQIDTRALPRRYYRSTIYTRYQKTGWAEADPGSYQPLEAAMIEQPGRSRVQQEITIVVPHTGWLYAVAQPVSSPDDVQFLAQSSTQTTLIAGKSSQYQVTSLAANVTAAQLQAASQQYPPEIVREYLSLPPDLPGRISQLTRQILAGSTNPYQQAIRIQNYLRATYTYDLAANAPAGTTDYVDYFLFEAQAGYCTAFSSSMVVMLRTAGIPARVAAGYSSGIYDYTRNAYRVPASAAHAWVEIYFPGYGWVEFEPTPSQNVFFYGPDDQQFSAVQPNQPEQPARQSRTLLLVLAFSTAALALLGVAAFFWLRRRPVMEGGPAGRLYWEIRHALRLAGLVAPAQATPQEFIEVCLPALRDHANLQSVLQHATDLFTRAMFTRTAPLSAEVISLRREWQQARWSWLRLVVRRRMVAGQKEI